ncbi:MAG: DUF3149 domain-containing protein [Ignavibacteria bacterium]
MAWIELFTTDIGLLSLFTIAFIIVMAIYIVYFVKQRLAEEKATGGMGAKLPTAH